MKATRTRLLSLLVAALFCGPALAEDLVKVTVTGEGISADAARNDALRRALEQGGQTEITSHSQVENFELIRDTIYSRAAGIVKDYKILEEGDGAGGIKYCKIEAMVSKSAVATAWGDVQNVLDQIGRPKVMVWIDETIDGAIQTSSILESKIEEKLVKSGFDVYAREQIDAITQRESADAAAEDDVAKMQALAKDFDCQIFIRGHGNANTAGVEDLYGVKAAMYNCDVQAKTYYTDTARLLASESEPNIRRGARGQMEFSPQAAKTALSAAGEKIVDKTYQTVMESWATQISAGGEIRLEVSGLKVPDAIKLKKKLADIDGVEKVHYQMTKGIANYRIVAKMTAETFTEYLVEPEWEELIEITDVKLNRIQAKAAGE
jgi:hypothetical protein